MNATIQMDASGRLVLPKVLRERLNLRAGASLRASVVAGHIELVPLADAEAPPLLRKGGLTVIAATGRKLDAAAAVAAEREAQAGQGQRRR